MEIMVHGNARKYYSPDEVRINFEFYTKGQTYEEALNNGVKNVQNFIENVLKVLGFSKDDMKTNSFVVSEEKKYDYKEEKEIKLGFAYRQSASIKFDYSIDTIGKFMEEIKKISNPPKCKMLFTIKDMEKVKNELLADAYIKAKEKAEIIARVAKKVLKDCVKTDFRPFENSVFSKTNLDANALLSENAHFKVAKASVNEMITNTFTPEDIEIEENIYCLWITD